MPAAPAGQLTVQLHFEKWACFKAFGKENAKRLLGGNGTVQVILTPRVEEGSTVRLDAEIGDIEADGSLGEALRSGSLGDALRDKIREALLKAIRKAAYLEAVVPAQVRPFVTVQTVAFADGGSARRTAHPGRAVTGPGNTGYFGAGAVAQLQMMAWVKCYAERERAVENPDAQANRLRIRHPRTGVLSYFVTPANPMVSTLTSADEPPAFNQVDFLVLHLTHCFFSASQ